MLRKAYSTFEIKRVSDSERVLEGVASTPTADRMADIVDSLGAEYDLPLPFLWQHDAEQPIGHVVSARPSHSGIPVRIELVKLTEPFSLKQRLDEAWAQIKHKLVRGLSIGFTPVEYSFIKETGGIHFTRWKWLELSAVTIPANSEASITNVKRFDVVPVKRTHRGPVYLTGPRAVQPPQEIDLAQVIEGLERMTPEQTKAALLKCARDELNKRRG